MNEKKAAPAVETGPTREALLAANRIYDTLDYRKRGGDEVVRIARIIDEAASQSSGPPPTRAWHSSGANSEPKAAQGTTRWDTAEKVVGVLIDHGWLKLSMNEATLIEIIGLVERTIMAASQTSGGTPATQQAPLTPYGELLARLDRIRKTVDIARANYPHSDKWLNMYADDVEDMLKLIDSLTKLDDSPAQPSGQTPGTLPVEFAKWCAEHSPKQLREAYLALWKDRDEQEHRAARAERELQALRESGGTGALGKCASHPGDLIAFPKDPHKKTERCVNWQPLAPSSPTPAAPLIIHPDDVSKYWEGARVIPTPAAEPDRQTCKHCGLRIYQDTTMMVPKWRHHGSNFVECNANKPEPVATPAAEPLTPEEALEGAAQIDETLSRETKEAK